MLLHGAFLCYRKFMYKAFREFIKFLYIICHSLALELRLMLVLTL